MPGITNTSLARFHLDAWIRIFKISRDETTRREQSFEDSAPQIRPEDHSRIQCLRRRRTVVCRGIVSLAGQSTSSSQQSGGEHQAPVNGERFAYYHKVRALNFYYVGRVGSRRARQLEMMNIFLGFEQTNRYAISMSSALHLNTKSTYFRTKGNTAGEPLGYIAEEPRGVLSIFSRQIFRTHRPFRAVILDLHGSPILWVICSMYLQVT